MGRPGWRAVGRAVLLWVLAWPGSGLPADGAWPADVVQALRAGQSQRALALALDAASKGEVWAMDLAGTIYLAGPPPVRRDEASARQWLSRAADAGDADAMNRLGEMALHGWGEPADPARAVAWYRRASDLGSAAGMNNLAACLLEGTGVPRSVDEGLALLRRAALRDPIAQENLARIERSGAYGPADPAGALALFEQAAGSGSSSAMVAASQMYFNGEGVAKDLARSCRWALLAYTKGRPEAAAHVLNVCRPQLGREAMARESQAAKDWIDAHPDAYGALARP